MPAVVRTFSDGIFTLHLEINADSPRLWLAYPNYGFMTHFLQQRFSRITDNLKGKQVSASEAMERINMIRLTEEGEPLVYSYNCENSVTWLYIRNREENILRITINQQEASELVQCWEQNMREFQRGFDSLGNALANVFKVGLQETEASPEDLEVLPVLCGNMHNRAAYRKWFPNAHRRIDAFTHDCFDPQVQRC